ncbi:MULTISPECIES: phage tail assembly protein T [Pseudomonas]|uniref:phage tail assembly protein T n=1 Tax=Pseudomonas TaxID=286 RepID=UPI00102357B9|nr:MULTISPECIES: hypothetical protein [Pseudomonas]MBW9244198.1 hypothetical protein [Pseudomonas paracarnis]RZI28280.1 hypothetical protein EUX58_02245 [Pseudomonas sp. 770NI]
MLNGVGGRTVAEAKASISYTEAMAWAAYRNKHGSFSVTSRAEQMGAIIALQVNRLGGGTAELIDFMPHQEKAGVSLETAMAEWA